MSAAERIMQRQNLIIKILTGAPGNKTNGAAIREHIEQAFGKSVSKGTLSSDIKSLTGKGYRIVSEKDGYRLLNPGYDHKQDPKIKEAESFAPITADTVAQWIIMHILSEGKDKYLSARDICEKYTQLCGKVSLSRIKVLLKSLEGRKFITRHTGDEAWEAGQTYLSEVGESGNKAFYHISDTAPVVSFVDREKVMDFNAYYHDGGYAGELRGAFKQINDKIAYICPDMYKDGSGAYKSSGKRNDITSGSTERLDCILRLPFRKYALNIKYREKESAKKYIFKTALIIFNAETNMFYLLGEVKNKNRWIRKNLKLSAVTDMSVNADVPNDIFESRKYKDIFRKMWSSAPDEPCEVEVVFKDTPRIREVIKTLARARSDTASVSYPSGQSQSGTESLIRYRDHISGAHDFFRFVRSMGDEAVIVRPLKSRVHMISKTGEMIRGYEDILGI